MNRKIIAQGGQAYTITLPIKWVREHGVDKLSEIDVIELENSLVLRAPEVQSSKSVTIALSQKPKRLHRLYISCAYAAGYDEVIVDQKIDAKDLTQCLGFVIVRSNSQTVIKDISGVASQNIEEIFKQLFQMIISHYKEAMRLLFVEKNYNSALLRERDIEINKFCWYLLRAVVKHKYTNSLESKLLFAYAYNLEQLSDEIVRMYAGARREACTKEVHTIVMRGEQVLEFAFNALHSKMSSERVYTLRDTLRTKSYESITAKNAIVLKRFVKVIELATDLSQLTTIKHIER